LSTIKRAEFPTIKPANDSAELPAIVTTVFTTVDAAVVSANITTIETTVHSAIKAAYTPTY